MSGLILTVFPGHLSGSYGSSMLQYDQSDYVYMCSYTDLRDYFFLVIITHEV